VTSAPDVTFLESSSSFVYPDASPTTRTHQKSQTMPTTSLDPVIESSSTSLSQEPALSPTFFPSMQSTPALASTGTTPVQFSSVQDEIQPTTTPTTPGASVRIETSVMKNISAIGKVVYNINPSFIQFIDSKSIILFSLVCLPRF
jgi:hypothetical protein